MACGLCVCVCVSTRWSFPPLTSSCLHSVPQLRVVKLRWRCVCVCMGETLLCNNNLCIHTTICLSLISFGRQAFFLIFFNWRHSDWRNKQRFYSQQLSQEKFSFASPAVGREVGSGERKCRGPMTIPPHPISRAHHSNSRVWWKDIQSPCPLQQMDDHMSGFSRTK